MGCLLVGWRYVVTNMNPGHDQAISLTDMTNDAQSGNISEVTINGTEVTGKFKDGKETFHTTIPANYPDLYNNLIQHGVNVIQKDQNGTLWLNILFQIAPIAVILALFLFMMRQMQSGGNKALSFGKNRARLLSMQQKKVTFKDVAGVDEAKEELKEIIEFLREAQKFQRLGGRIPKGVLMVGPPGTGKTLLARAWPARRTFRSSRSRVRTLWRCLSASVRAACATCLSRARRMPLASSSSTRLTL